MWIQIEPDTWVNTDHIIVVDLKRGVLATTRPPFAAQANLRPSGVKAIE